MSQHFDTRHLLGRSGTLTYSVVSLILYAGMSRELGFGFVLSYVYLTCICCFTLHRYRRCPVCAIYL